ncbi:MAG: hypothetical protein A2X94_05230 [Bdellovibrionales bacterium GWB1_55_8]|nr:MAG: hypothetical protein A2X94_05230 [Bdellovibrionales bacterium GWB1_55_8]
MLNLMNRVGMPSALILSLGLGFSGLVRANDEAMLADDIIPQEELADEEGLYPERDFLRRSSPKELAKHKARRVQIVVYKTMQKTGRQHMEVFVDGSLQEIFTVSTAWERKGLKGKSGRVYNPVTPNGTFIPDSLERKRYSNLWKVWLHYVIPFSGGVWVHATTPDHYAELGAPASGGCVRMHLEDAERLFTIVKQYGMNETAITVVPAPAGEKQVRPAKAPGR